MISSLHCTAVGLIENHHMIDWGSCTTWGVIGHLEIYNLLFVLKMHDEMTYSYIAQR